MMHLTVQTKTCGTFETRDPIDQEYKPLRQVMELGAEVQGLPSSRHKGPRKDGRIWPIHIDFHTMWLSG